MKLLILGASGMIGARILAEAVERGHDVVAASRNPEKIASGDKVRAVALDVADVDAVTQAAEGVDVIVQAVSPRSTDDAVSEMAAIGGGSLGAALATGKRLIVVGGAGTLTLPDGSPVLATLPDFIVPEATGMRNLKQSLAESAADWTYIAPAAMIEPGARTGKFRLGGDVLMADEQGDSKISAEDFAVALLDEVESKAHPKEVMSVAY
ncbi:NAD(P)H-binding protein [Rhodobacteraceae bacterium D3-12]|nr:NAD(P)H-binding protein [Rhodobacteraceae bacterium D3-12]